MIVFFISETCFKYFLHLFFFVNLRYKFVYCIFLFEVPQDNGASCRRNDECQSNICEQDSCVECSNSGDCGDGKYCSDTVCLFKKGDWQECYENYECLSNYCNTTESDEDDPGRCFT